MMICSKEAFARCPTAHLCGSREQATFAEGSECDKFNQAAKSMSKPKTNGDRIRSMNDYELAVFLAKVKADVERDDLLVVAYSTQDSANNLEWLYRPLPYSDDDRHEHSGLLEE